MAGHFAHVRELYLDLLNSSMENAFTLETLVGTPVKKRLLQCKVLSSACHNCHLFCTRLAGEVNTNSWVWYTCQSFWIVATIHACIFNLCPKLQDLTIRMDLYWRNEGKMPQNSEKHEDLARQLKHGFSRLEHVKLSCLRRNRGEQKGGCISTIWIFTTEWI